MSRKTIAPTLRWHIQEPFASDPAAFRAAVPEMVRELRALLAVARAAEDHSHAEVEPVPEGETETCPICRALARLNRKPRGRSGSAGERR